MDVAPQSISTYRHSQEKFLIIMLLKLMLDTDHNGYKSSAFYQPHLYDISLIYYAIQNTR